MANSSTVTANVDTATAAQYNNLRLDVLNTSSGHVHNGTDGRAHGDLALTITGSIDFTTGAAMTAGKHAIGRDADGTNQLHLNVPTGATMEFSINDVAQWLAILGGFRFSTGAAVTAAQYEVVRDADGTNQLHFNVPTGASFEFSVNDTPEMTLTATTLNLLNNAITTTGALTGTGGTITNTTLVNPALGTPASGVLTNMTGVPASSATQAQMEAETVTTLVTADKVKNSPGVAKAWARINADGTLTLESYNVASVTDTGAGDRTIVIATDFSGTSWLADGSLNAAIGFADQQWDFREHAAGSVRQVCFIVTTPTDMAIGFTAWGDQ